jgi:hypothetical protein
MYLPKYIESSMFYRHPTKSRANLPLEADQLQLSIGVPLCVLCRPCCSKGHATFMVYMVCKKTSHRHGVTCVRIEQLTRLHPVCFEPGEMERQTKIPAHSDHQKRIQEQIQDHQRLLLARRRSSHAREHLQKVGLAQECHSNRQTLVIDHSNSCPTSCHNKQPHQ